MFDFNLGQGNGLGHLSRCIAVAESMRNIGYRAFFHSNQDWTSKAVQMLNQSEFGLERIMPKHFNVQVIDRYCRKNEVLRRDAELTVQFVDHISEDLEVDAYVCVSPSNNWVLNKVYHKTFDMDPPLRKEVIDRSKNMDDIVNNRILFLSGGDSHKSLKKSLVRSTESNPGFFPIDILSAVKNEIIDINKTNINMVYVKDNYFQLIDGYSYIISACGVSAWELLALNKKVVFYSLAINQDYQINFLSHFGYKQILNFDSKSNNFTNLADCVTELRERKDWPKSIVNLSGSTNIASYIESLL